METSAATKPPVQAAGGIVLGAGREPVFAVVQLRKDNAWVLPKGKLKPGENMLAAARREVIEETGHDVTVYEQVGTMPQAPGAKPKIVQFWRMRASARPVRKLMRDVRAVRWLPLPQALETLTHPHERAFLAGVGPAVIAAGQHDRRVTIGGLIGRLRGWLRALSGRPAAGGRGGRALP